MASSASAGKAGDPSDGPEATRAAPAAATSGTASDPDGPGDNGGSDGPSDADPATPAPVASHETGPAPQPVLASVSLDVAAASQTAASGAPARVSSGTLATVATQTATEAAAGSSQFQIELHPLGLGRVDVSVQIGPTGALSAAFAFDRPQTAQDFAARSGELQKALEQAGFTVADSGLSFSTAHAAAASGIGQTQGEGGGPASHGPGQTSAQTSAQTAGAASGQGGGQGFSQGSRQDTPRGAEPHGRHRAFAAAGETVDAADQPRPSAYASRATRGVDLRI